MKKPGKQKPKNLKLERIQRRFNLARAIKHSYGSLQTHLYDSVNPCPRSHARGNEEWNARCVREYGETIYTLSVELHELARIDSPETFTDFDRLP